MSWKPEEIREMLEELDDETFEEAVRIRIGEKKVSKSRPHVWRQVWPYVLTAACMLLLIGLATVNILHQRNEKEIFVPVPAATLEHTEQMNGQVSGNETDELTMLREKYQTLNHASYDLSGVNPLARYKYNMCAVVLVEIQNSSYVEGQTGICFVKCEVLETLNNEEALMAGDVIYICFYQEQYELLAAEAGQKLIIPLCQEEGMVLWNSQAQSAYWMMVDPSLFYVLEDDTIIAGYQEDQQYDGMTYSAFKEQLQRAKE
jgi:hypothetical protein